MSQGERAKILEAQGNAEEAAKAFLAAGDVDSAVRALLGGHRFREAAAVLIKDAGGAFEGTEPLAGKLRQRAQQAAFCLAKAGDVARAAALYQRVGDVVRAQELLAKHPRAGTSLAPNSQERARKALEASDPKTAGGLYLTAGMPYEAAQCFIRAVEMPAALDAMMRVTRSHPKYREACVKAIEMAVELDALEFRLDEFLSHFLQGPPLDVAEADAMYALCRLFRNHDLPDSAREVLEKISAFDPHYKDVAQQIADLSHTGRGSAMTFERIVREDASFHRRPKVGPADPVAPKKLPSLPPLEHAHTMMGMQHESGVSVKPHAGHAPVTQGAVPQAAVPATIVEPVPGVATQGASADAEPEGHGTLFVGMLPIGTVIDSRYELLREVGRGGMAAVYEAHDRELDERVAMKFFFGSGDQELLLRFKQELSLSRKLGHPNIVKVFDIGTYHGSKFISMELLSGKSMSSHLRRGLSREVLVNLLIQTCAGLHAAHEAGVVHRDVKPENLFVTEAGIVKVMDFGIAKQSAKPGLTRAGYMAGTPHYMAPEQIFNFGAVDRRADIYSLGVVAYEMFCGCLPFATDDMMELLQKHVKETPPRPREVVADIPELLDALIMKCLEKKPDDRFDSCRSMAAALQTIRAAV